jgi:hypothetical protein
MGLAELALCWARVLPGAPRPQLEVEDEHPSFADLLAPLRRDKSLRAHLSRPSALARAARARARGVPPARRRVAGYRPHRRLA